MIQGLTEFLPISSSAHLRIFPELFGWGDPGAAFTAVIQIGTELAVLIYFRKDIWRIVIDLGAVAGPARSTAATSTPGWAGTSSSARCRSWSSASCSRTSSSSDFRSLWLIGTTLIVLGVVLGIADRVGAHRQARSSEMHPARRGPAWAWPRRCALIPGVSRSGATLSMGRFLGYDREAATRYAFLLAIPAVVGAGLFELKEIPGGDNAYGWGPTIVATVVSFVVGYAAIAWLLRYVSHALLPPFVIYRVAPRRSCTLVLRRHRRARRA